MPRCTGNFCRCRNSLAGDPGKYYGGGFQEFLSGFIPGINFPCKKLFPADPLPVKKEQIRRLETRSGDGRLPQTASSSSFGNKGGQKESEKEWSRLNEGEESPCIYYGK